MMVVMWVLNEWFRSTVVEVLYEEDRVDNAEPTSQVGLRKSQPYLTSLLILRDVLGKAADQSRDNRSDLSSPLDTVSAVF